MADDMKFGLSDLQVTDDLDIALDNDTYQDQANPAPPVYGNYRVKALSIEPAKNKAGEQVKEAGTYPIFRLPMIEIVEGLGDGVTRKVGVFHDIKTKPFDRFGVPASGLGDLTRAYGTRNWRGLDPNDPESGVSVLKEAFEQSGLFGIQLDWSIYDKAFIDAAFEQLGIATGAQLRESNGVRSDEEKKLVGAIYNAGRVTGMKYFPYDADKARFVHVLARENVTVKDPRTNAPVVIEVEHRTFEARPVITRFYPAKDVEAGRVKFGPIKVRPAALAIA